MALVTHCRSHPLCFRLPEDHTPSHPPGQALQREDIGPRTAGLAGQPASNSSSPPTSHLPAPLTLPLMMLVPLQVLSVLQGQGYGG